MRRSELHQKTLKELRQIARDLGVGGRSTMTKEKLISLILELSPEEGKPPSAGREGRSGKRTESKRASLIWD
jgi:hypothetical protein